MPELQTRPYIAAKRHALPEVVRALKSFSARRINASRNEKGIPVWQRNYYEHVIRNSRDFQAIYDYILTNPPNWEKDDLYLK